MLKSHFSFEIELHHITQINEIFVLFFEAAVLLCCWLEVLRNIIKARKDKSCKAIREFEVLTTEFILSSWFTGLELRNLNGNFYLSDWKTIYNM